MEEQSWRRTNRIGQTENNFVHVLRIERSVDDWMANLIEHKAGVIGGFNDKAQDIAGSLLKAIEDGDMI